VRGERSHISVRTYPYGYRKEEFKIKTSKNPVIARFFEVLLDIKDYIV
jgi:hypothetical protein